MNNESPRKKNPILNFGILVTSVGLLMTTFFESVETIGGVIAIIGLIFLFTGYRKAKASGSPPIPMNERRRRLRLIMISMATGFLISPFFVWSTISKLRGIGIWIFIVGELITVTGIFGFYIWLYKKAGQNNTDES